MGHPFFGRGIQRGYKNFLFDRLPLGFHNDVNIIKIPWPGVEHTPSQNCLNLFCQDPFDGIGPDLDQLVFKTRMECIPDGLWGNNIAGCYIDLQRGINRFVPGNNRYSITAIFVILPDGNNMIKDQSLTAMWSSKGHFLQKNNVHRCNFYPIIFSLGWYCSTSAR